jgi:hypothetical protein
LALIVEVSAAAQKLYRIDGVADNAAARMSSSDLPANDHKALVDRMNQSLAKRFDSRPELDVQDLGRNHLERPPQRFKQNLSWNVFVADRNDTLSLGSIRGLELQTVAQQTRVSGIRVQQVHGPILCPSSIVTEWPGQLKLECPASFDHRSGVRITFAQASYRWVLFRRSATSLTS